MNLYHKHTKERIRIIALSCFLRTPIAYTYDESRPFKCLNQAEIIDQNDNNLSSLQISIIIDGNNPNEIIPLMRFIQDQLGRVFLGQCIQSTYKLTETHERLIKLYSQ